MTQLNLSHFAGIDPARLNPTELDTVRHAFAAAVCDHAAQCADNEELMASLFQACDPSLGLEPPAVLGEGSTRRAWSLPYGLVLKVRRNDTLEDHEMERRGSLSYLYSRRRTALIGEVLTAIAFGQMVPKVYGLLFSFGLRPPNPELLISEAITPLDVQRPDDAKRLSLDTMFVCQTTGRLLVVEPPTAALASFRPSEG